MVYALSERPFSLEARDHADINAVGLSDRSQGFASRPALDGLGALVVAQLGHLTLAKSINAGQMLNID